METFTKYPDEGYTIAIEFDGKLPESSDPENPIVIASGTFAALNKNTNEDATSDLIPDTNAVIVDTQAQAFIEGGVLGNDYIITCTVVLSPGSPVPSLHEDVVVYVRDIIS